jgi:cytochrome P450
LYSVIYPIKHNFKEDKIGVFSERIQNALKIGLDSLLDIKKGEERVINTWDTFTVLISNISCPCFAGSKVGYNKDLIIGMASFTQKIIRAGMVMTTLPEWLGNIIVRRFLSVEHEMDIIMGLLVPELEKIRNGEVDADQEEVTFSAMALKVPKEDGSQRSVQDAAYYFNSIALASIHTTSHFTTFALHELSCRPSLVQDLRTELATLGNDRTPESVATLSLMDSFFREVLRHNTDHMGLHHLALKDTTLSTGQVIPKDSMVVCAIDQVHRDERFLPIDEDTGEACLGDSPLDQFDAYRFYGKNIKSTTVGLEYLPFGLGAHACPGRFFAVNEIKYVIGELLLRFNIKTKSGKRAKDNVLLGMTRFPPLEPLIFEGL